MKHIDEKTLVPVGVAVACIGGAAVWLTTIHLNQQAIAASLEEKKGVIERMASDIQEIKVSLAEFRAKCNLKNK